ncbi:MAG: 3-phosphoglycerate dehydrogenase [Bacteroidetes bacterium]|nr:3-phosphoglycerate dehydrogenase [Bacteroidota bacterium]
MKRVLANDGIADDGKRLLEEAGYEVITDKIAQADLPNRINEFDVLVVRSATKVTQEVLEPSNRMKLVVRAGVGVDNIDIAYARKKEIEVANTPQSSSLSVAELVFAHLFGVARFISQSNRDLPTQGKAKFNDLKKKYSEGVELRGKTIGIIGFGRIGQEVAKIAYSLGMEVIAHDVYIPEAKLRFDHLPFKPTPTIEIKTTNLIDVITKSDFITLHLPHNEGMPPVLGENEFSKMKNGVGIINCARGGVLSETALLAAIASGKVAFAGLDVFENEPNINDAILAENRISVTPHIGAATKEAQDRISIEVAQVIIIKTGNK